MPRAAPSTPRTQPQRTLCGYNEQNQTLSEQPAPQLHHIAKPLPCLHWAKPCSLMLNAPAAGGNGGAGVEGRCWGGSYLPAEGGEWVQALFILGGVALLGVIPAATLREQRQGEICRYRCWCSCWYLCPQCKQRMDTQHRARASLPPHSSSFGMK